MTVIRKHTWQNMDVEWHMSPLGHVVIKSVTRRSMPVMLDAITKAEIEHNLTAFFYDMEMDQPQ